MYLFTNCIQTSRLIGNRCRLLDLKDAKVLHSSLDDYAFFQTYYVNSNTVLFSHLIRNVIPNYLCAMIPSTYLFHACNWCFDAATTVSKINRFLFALKTTISFKSDADLVPKYRPWYEGISKEFFINECWISGETADLRIQSFGKK